nr:nymph-specific protein N6 [Ischnura senegalensis]
MVFKVAVLLALAFVSANAVPQQPFVVQTVGGQVFTGATIFDGPIAGNPRCRRNEIFLASGSGCTRTCGNFFQQTPTTTCTAANRPGCFCINDLVRDEWNRGLCVRPNKCSQLKRRRHHKHRSSENRSRSRN